MSCRKGEFCLYDCRERSVSKKVYLAFMAGLITGGFLVFYFLFSVIWI